MEFLQEARKAHNLTQAELAERVGATQSVISRIEAGKRYPSPFLAQRIASVLGFDWTEFFQEKTSD